MDFVIETERLTGGYGTSPVLREVSLRVPRASIYGFLGPNGAGKTTAMRMVLGLLRPFSGEIRLFGQPLTGALPGILRRVGSLIEQPSLYDHLTGTENLEIARRLKGLKRSDADRAVEALGVGEYVGRKVKEYSRGMRQRLGVAIAVLGNPELLLLDEPLNGLDANGLRTFRSALQRLHQEYGTTIVLSSHQFEEVEQVATHIGIMSGVGDLLFQGPRHELSGRVPQELVIKVDRWEEALNILASGGFTVDSRQEHLMIQGATSEMAREVNRLLVANGIGVHHLALDSATLEALFVKVTNEGLGLHIMQGAWALVSAEAIKIRRTLALWLVVVAPALAFTMLLILLFNRDSSLASGDARTMWRSVMGTGWSFWLGLVTPMLISFEAASLANLEHSGNQWKQLFAFPIPRWSVYATKMGFCGLLVGASFLVFALGFIGDALIFGAIRGLPLASAIPWSEILHLAGKAYVASWLVIAIQSWLSVRFSGIATPVGIGFAALVIGFGLLGVRGGPFSWWYPWTLPIRTLSGGPRDLHDTVLPAVFGCAGGVLVGALACWDLARWREGD